jgi:methionyl-tRNA synthetase
MSLTDEHRLKGMGTGLGETVAEAYQQLKFSQACSAVLGLVQASNKFLDEEAPWSLFKQGKQAETEAVLYAVLESVRLAAYLLSPVVPGLSNEIYRQLGYTVDFNQRSMSDQLSYAEQSTWGVLPSGQSLGEAKPIFQRIEVAEVTA